MNLRNPFVLAEFLRGGAYDRHLRKLRGLLQQQAKNLSSSVKEYFPGDTHFINPEGGLVLWLELSPEVDSFHFFEEARSQKISVFPGVLFSGTNRFSHYIRLSFGFPWEKKFEEGVQKLGGISSSLL